MAAISVRLTTKRAEDLVFVYTNMRLLDKVEAIGYSEAVPEPMSDDDDVVEEVDEEVEVEVEDEE